MILLPSLGWIFYKFLGIVFLVLAGIYIYFKYVLYNFWRKVGIPYEEPAVPTGNLWHVVTGKKCAGEVFLEIYNKHKKHRYFGMYTFQKPSLVVNDPDLIRVVLTKEFTSFHDRGLYCNEKNDPLSGHLFFLSGTKWKTLRSKLSPTFTSGRMKQMFKVITDCGQELEKFLAPRASKKEVIDVKDLFARFSTDIIMSAAFGITCNSLEIPNNEFRHWGKKSFESRPFMNAAVMFAPKLLDVLGLPFTDKGVQNFFINAFKDTVEYRQTHNITRHDFLNLLMQLMKTGHLEGEDSNSLDSNTKVSMLEGAAQAFVFFLAGFETSSSTVTACLYELARNENIQERLHQEITASAKKHGGVTYDSLFEMPYLHKVVSETLRKYPSVPMLNRVCTQDIDLPTTDFHIKKGTDIVIPVLGLHRDPDIYPDPEKFDPERFNDDQVAARHPYVYLPFGEGPRICIGMRFGLAQTKVAIMSILTKYRVTLTPDTPIPLIFDPGNIVLTVKDGLPLQIQER